MKRRILAWIALIVFLVLFINLLFFHYRSTETLVIMLFYVLFLIMKKRADNAERDELANQGSMDADDADEMDHTDDTKVEDDNNVSDSIKENVNQVNKIEDDINE